ncbi:MAG: histidinol-phosphatase HisJ family protein [Candidatus Omnitrophica bacterium]|nr:histidinol-phosphatase HisJ family protein [Candidatus Omnitrophota bacterium]
MEFSKTKKILPISDYHIHTYLCGHADGTPEEYVKQAIKRGLKEIGFSDHAPFLSHEDPSVTMSLKQFPDYFKLVDALKRKYKKQIVIKTGIEADFMVGYEKKTEELLSRYKFDYIIGSVHFINEWAFDDPKERPKWQGQDINGIYGTYHKLLRKAAGSKMFDIMAHVDLLKKFGDRPTEDLSKEVQKTARVFKKCGVAVEINSSGLRKPVKEIYPSLHDLKIYCQEGVPIVFGSDSHEPNQVAMDFDKAIQWAKMAGYKRYITLRSRKVERVIKI